MNSKKLVVITVVFLCTLTVLVLVNLWKKDKERRRANPEPVPIGAEDDLGEIYDEEEIFDLDIEPVFLRYPAINNRIKENSFYAEVINHCRNPVLGHDRDTNAHESSHRIASEIRNSNRSSGKVNGFYVGNDQAVVIQEPNIRKSQVARYIPRNLRAGRFSLYLIGQIEWDREPLYIFDEWVAYVNGGAVSVEDAERGRKHAWTDAVMGSLEFSIYSVAVAMAVADRDPTYWENNEQFRKFLIWHLRRSKELFYNGRSHFPWDKQDRLLANLRNDPQAAAMREFIQKHLDNVWLEEAYEAREYGPIDFSHIDGARRVFFIDGEEIGEY